ncbi:hypothetical protein [uncultured Novosphingobium sp.]|uniref:hypothetical protein n=1 Tax=uncultured Novosphingobium sp. TaxID=292277 RepID=UPI003748B271
MSGANGYNHGFDYLLRMRGLFKAARGGSASRDRFHHFVKHSAGQNHTPPLKQRLAGFIRQRFIGLFY